MLDCLVQNSKENGFTLVEMAIVLVVIGLLVGGILTARNLIRAAELNSLIFQVQKMQMAIKLFKERFKYMPGDLPMATKYWGAADSNSLTCKTTVGVGTLT